MGIRAIVTAVAAVGFTSDDGWAQHTFGLVVGGIEVIDVEKAKNVLAVFA